MLAPPITVRRVAATPRVMPRSMPWTAIWSGTVIRVGKKKNWAAQRVQNTRLRRISAKPPPRPGAEAGAAGAAGRSGGGRLIETARNEQQHRRGDPQGERRPAPPKAGDQDRRQRRQHHLTGRGADLRDPGHHPAPAREPARDGRKGRERRGCSSRRR